MPFKKQYLKSKPVCKVTFKLSKEAAQTADSVCLVGDFNDWDTTGNPMKKLKDGSFSTSIDLATEKQYQFRYLLNDNVWENDSEADEYLPTAVSYEENSVINI